MKRTTGDNNINNLFVDGPPGTTVEASWFNNVQEEIISVLVAENIPLDENNQTQLLAALDARFTEGDLAITGGLSRNSQPVLNNLQLDIGDWNMDANSNASVAHGLVALGATFLDVRSVNILIRHDADVQFFPLLLEGGGGVHLSPTNVELSRIGGGLFDNVNFDSLGFNRGYITIDYVS